MRQFVLGVIGALLGAFIPCASYTLARFECQSYHYLWALVIGGFLFSSFTVFDWARRAFGHEVKAVGFVILTEGVLVLCHTQWLAISGLVILAGVNAAATCSNLVHQEEAQEAPRGGITTLGISGYTPVTPKQETKRLTKRSKAASTDRVRRFRERQRAARSTPKETTPKPVV